MRPKYPPNSSRSFTGAIGTVPTIALDQRLKSARSAGSMPSISAMTVIGSGIAKLLDDVERLARDDLVEQPDGDLPDARFELGDRCAA